MRLIAASLAALSFATCSPAAAAMPLTASWATHYVDAPARPQNASIAAVQPATVRPQASSAAVAAPTPASTELPATSIRVNGDGTVTLAGGVTLDKGSTAFFANDDILINGQVKRLDQLTPLERSKVRATILRSQRDLARDRAELPGELAELGREADRARNGQLRREIVEAREDLRRHLAEVDLDADRLRANGEDPEKRKAEIRKDLGEAEAIDIDRLEREAIENADPAKGLAELRADEAQMARMLARLDQLDRR